MSLRIFEGIGGVLLVLVLLVGGLYFYSVGQEDDIILELTFEQLKTLEKPDVVSFEATTSTTVVSADPSVAPQDVTIPTFVSGSVTQDVVTVGTPASELVFTVDEFLATNPFGDVDFWLDEIRAGNYTVESLGEDENAVWQYTFLSDDLQASYLQTLTPQLVGIVSGGAVGFDVTNPQVSFDGTMTFVVTIGSNDNVIDTIDIIADAPIELSFDLVSEELGTIPSATSFEGVESNVVFTEFTLQDGQSIPTNPFLVFIASLM